MRRVCAIAVSAVVLTTALAAQYAAERIALDEFRKLHAAGKVLVVDVRGERDFLNGHIPGAMNIPLGSEAQQAAKLKGEKRPIVTYCA
jgi:rhodanese-related sulfurtransferase